jgi:hypothetical protein
MLNLNGEVEKFGEYLIWIGNCREYQPVCDLEITKKDDINNGQTAKIIAYEEKRYED